MSISDALVPVTSVGWTMTDSDGELTALPSVALDIAGRPDIADLARVHEMDGIGDIRTLATAAGDGGVRFDVVIMSPVKCHIAFVVSADDQPLLHDAAQRETLVLATGDPSVVDATWLAVYVERAALTAVLNSPNT